MTESLASSVVDASALLAFVFDEPGGPRFLGMIGENPVMSTVSWSEVGQKALAYGVSPSDAGRVAAAAGLDFAPLTLARADRLAGLWALARELGLTLAERACLALGLEFGCPVVTAVGAWQQIELAGLEIRLLR